MRRAFTLGAILFVLHAAPAHAYLDAGSVSMALQAITATVAAGMAGLVLFWGRLKSMVFGRSDTTTSEASEEKSPER